ncbi:MAG: hypothetical protein LBU45_06580 [Azoarcus sp.]|nr:hypothetical protein [Azoarcus sp.]
MTRINIKRRLTTPASRVIDLARGVKAFRGVLIGMFRLVLHLFAALTALIVIGGFHRGCLPHIGLAGIAALDAITDYQPRVPLRVYTADGYLIKETGEERRAVVKIENVPAFPARVLATTLDFDLSVLTSSSKRQSGLAILHIDKR